MKHISTMKPLSVLLMFTTVTVSVAQNQLELPVIPFTPSGDVEYQEVVEINDASKQDLYSRAREWFAVTYKSSDAVLEIDDKGTGKMLGKPYNSLTVMSGNIPVETRLFYTILIEMKDGRYRYTINNLYYKSLPFSDQYGTLYPATASYPKEIMNDEALQKAPNKRHLKLLLSYRQATYDSMQNLIASLKKAMQENENDDW